ncbi:E motif [Dillenia turbinata]|uniref:E motif n=1 Tax=Dillenia turbinata TaxID=194707 RepID=A0AAN8Z7X8_9MAGN
MNLIPGKFQALFQRSKTTSHLLQLLSLILKTSLDQNPKFISEFIHISSSISLDFSRLLFDRLLISPPLFAWISLIRAYSKSATPIQAAELFSLLRKSGAKPDHLTYPFVVKACGRCSMLGVGGGVQSLISKVGSELNVHITSTLVRMYAGCNEIGLARKVFEEMGQRDLASWSSMIAGYVACGQPLDALLVFEHMKLAHEKPNSITLVSLLSACAFIPNISTGELIHSYIIVNGMNLDVALGTALLEMYSKCGHIEKAFQVFSSMTDKNVQTWTVMISALAHHGQGEDSISLFSEMERTGIKPDSFAFSSILSACSHLRLIDEGQKYFDQMVRVYDIKPTLEHYGCLVDMFGRAGMMREAYAIIKHMPMKPNTVILRSFLGACKTHGSDYQFNKHLRKLLLQIEPDLGDNYVISASISSLSGSWSDAAKLRVVMKEKGMKKVPGCSWVEVTGNR